MNYRRGAKKNSSKSVSDVIGAVGSTKFFDGKRTQRAVALVPPAESIAERLASLYGDAIPAALLIAGDHREIPFDYVKDPVYAATIMHEQELASDNVYADPDYRLPFGEKNTATLDATLTALQDACLTPHLIRLSEDDVQAKIDSVCAYRSQVPMLFGDAAAMAERLRAFSTRLDDDGPAERFWIPGGVDFGF